MKRLYILIRNTLDPIYGCVQGGHAVAQFMLEHPEDWKNQYLIYLSADIDKQMYRLDKLNIEYTVFKEPDLDNQITAIAILDNANLFKNLKLIR